MGTWTLPGYQVEELLGFGATGEVWRARCSATGETVALKRLRPGAGLEAVAALRREAAVLRSLETPFIVRLRDVVGSGADAVLVLDYAPGGSLASLLALRGTLSPGEVVTVAAPLAQALAAAHQRGLVHGDVSPANVLFTSDGMPLLTDLGLARSVDEPGGDVHGTAEYVDPAVAAGAEPGPPSDVWALGALCFQLLAGSPPHEGHTVGQVLTAARNGARAPLGLLAPTVPRALVAVVEGALHEDPSRRPSAGALAVALQRAHGPAPVNLSGARPQAAVPAPPRVTHAVPRPGPAHAAPPPGRRRPSVWAVAGSAVVMLLLTGGLVWALRAGEGRPPALPSVAVPEVQASSAPAAEDWPGVLDAIDQHRERAFATGDAALLDQVYEPGSAVRSADQAALADLVAAARTATGVRHHVQAATVVTRTTGRVTLHTEDRLDPQVVRDASGAVVEERPGRGVAGFEVVLVDHGDGWRIAAITPT